MSKGPKRGEDLKLLQTGVAAFQAGKIGKALQDFDKVLKASPTHPDAHYLRGLCLHVQGHAKPAAVSCRKAEQFGIHAHPEVLNNMGQIFRAAGDVEQAVRTFRRALDLAPGAPEICNNLANALADAGETDEALALYQRAISANPRFVKAYINLADCLRQKERLPESAGILRQALAIDPANPDARAALAGILLDLGDSLEGHALAASVLAEDKDHALANAVAGRLLVMQKRPHDAISHLEKAAAARAFAPTALINLGIAYTDAGQMEAAAKVLRRTCKEFPGCGAAIAAFYENQERQCDWRDIEAIGRELDRAVEAALAAGEVSPESPIRSANRTMDPERTRQVAESHATVIARRAGQSGLQFPPRRPMEHGRRLRLGYVSGHLWNHAGGHALKQLFELHDRAAFEVFAYSSGPDDGSDYRRHFETTSEHFIDIRAMSDAAAARRIAEDEIDLLVDLTGHSTGHRLAVMAMRPSPVNIAWFGYPGPIGGGIVDYLVVDRLVAPPEHRSAYPEALIFLPHSYAMVDDRMGATPLPATRSEEGLPEDAIVFASFCGPQKYDPVMFRRWMAVLRAVPRAVLWLYAQNPTTRDNLAREARGCGIEPSRLVFAAPRPKDQHIARLRLADLALDTRIYNGHVTSADCLLAGLPLVAIEGGHFASRVSMSLLHAAGMPEMVVPDLDRWQELTIDLASHPGKLKAVRDKLARMRKEAPLFDSASFVRNLERAYRDVWSAYQAGRPPVDVTL